MINLGTNERIPGTSDYGSVDPAPPTVSGNIDLWRKILLDENQRMFERMRVVFSLRNDRSSDAALILCEGFRAKSALLRHEIAYVLGQMQNPIAVDTLVDRLRDRNEHVMVRHEAAEALGAIGDRRAEPVLMEFLTDENPEVSESCEVALDLLELCSSDEKIVW